MTLILIHVTINSYICHNTYIFYVFISELDLQIYTWVGQGVFMMPECFQILHFINGPRKGSCSQRCECVFCFLFQNVDLMLTETVYLVNIRYVLALICWGWNFMHANFFLYISGKIVHTCCILYSKSL